MPTVKPRVQVTLDHKVYEALHAYSKAAGQSMSSILSDVASDSAPTFMALAEMINISKRMDADARALLAEKLQGTERDMSEAMESFRALIAPRASNTGAKLSAIPDNDEKLH